MHHESHRTLRHLYARRSGCLALAIGLVLLVVVGGGPSCRLKVTPEDQGPIESWEPAGEGRFEETLGSLWRYKAYWVGLPVGEVLIGGARIAGMSHLVFEIRTIGILGFIASGWQRIESLASREFLPLAVQVALRKGDTSRRMTYAFGGPLPGPMTGGSEDPSVIQMAGPLRNLWDPLGAAFLVRATDFEPGRQRGIDVLGNEGIYALRVRCTGYATVDVGRDPRRCRVVEVSYRLKDYDGVLKGESTLGTFWIGEEPCAPIYAAEMNLKRWSLTLVLEESQPVGPSDLETPFLL